MLQISAFIAYFILSLAMVFGFIRLVRGPSLPDRVVALELIASLTIGYIAVYVVTSGKTAFLDVAMVLALTAFLTAVGFARYLEKGGRKNGR